MHLYGNSWGSTLALCYAISHPDRIKKMMIGGVFLGTRSEDSYIFNGTDGGLKKFFPEAWERYTELMPDNTKDTIEFYKHALSTDDDEEKLEHYKRWVQLEGSAMTMDDDYKGFRLSIDSIDELTPEAVNKELLSIHYFSNGCFLEDDYIINNVNKIKHIPIVITQGRFDMVCRPEVAHRLAKTLGDSCRLHIVPANHKSEGALREVQRAYAWSFLN